MCGDCAACGVSCRYCLTRARVLWAASAISDRGYDLVEACITIFQRHMVELSTSDVAADGAVALKQKVRGRRRLRVSVTCSFLTPFSSTFLPCSFVWRTTALTSGRT